MPKKSKLLIQFLTSSARRKCRNPYRPWATHTATLNQRETCRFNALPVKHKVSLSFVHVKNSDTLPNDETTASAEVVSAYHCHLDPARECRQNRLHVKARLRH